MFVGVVWVLHSRFEQMDTVAGTRHSQGNVASSQLESLIIYETSAAKVSQTSSGWSALILGASCGFLLAVP